MNASIIVDFIDRYVIAKLRYIKTKKTKEEYDYYNEQINFINTEKISPYLKKLFNANKGVWDTENKIARELKKDFINFNKLARLAMYACRYNKKRRLIKKNLANVLQNLSSFALNLPEYEAADRYCIERVKLEKLPYMSKEPAIFYKKILKNQRIIKKELDILYKLHKNIWDYENDFQQGTISKYSSAEVALKAIIVRKLFRLRNKVKLLIAKKTKDKIKEIKYYK